MHPKTHWGLYSDTPSAEWETKTAVSDCPLPLDRIAALLLDELELVCKRHRLRAAFDSEFAVDVADVAFSRLD